MAKIDADVYFLCIGQYNILFFFMLLNIGIPLNNFLGTHSLGAPHFWEVLFPLIDDESSGIFYHQRIVLELLDQVFVSIFPGVRNNQTKKNQITTKKILSFEKPSIGNPDGITVLNLKSPGCPMLHLHT